MTAAAAAAAAAVTLLRFPIARLSSSFRSASSPSPPLSPSLLRLSASHGLPYPLLAPCHGRCLAVAAVAEAVGAPGAEVVESSEEERQGDSDPRPSFVLPRPKLSVKERKELASYAHGLGRKLKSQQVGKGGVTPAVVTAFNDNLESNELLKLKIHGNCPGELPDVILQLEESTGSIAVDQIGRSVILYRPSTSKMKKREESARNSMRFARSKEASEEHPRSSASKRFVRNGDTFRSRQIRRSPFASKGSSYSQG